MTAPMRGKKHMTYFIRSLVHSSWGIGTREYMENAITKLPKRFIFLLLIILKPGARPAHKIIISQNKKNVISIQNSCLCFLNNDAEHRV